MCYDLTVQLHLSGGSWKKSSLKVMASAVSEQGVVINLESNPVLDQVEYQYTFATVT